MQDKNEEGREREREGRRNGVRRKEMCCFIGIHNLHSSTRTHT